MRFLATRLFLDFEVCLKKPSLVRAAKRGNVRRVKSLLKRGVPVDVCDGLGRTALMEAARKGHLEIVRLLLEHGADVHQSSGSRRTAMSYAQERLVRELLGQSGSTQGKIP